MRLIAKTMTFIMLIFIMSSYAQVGENISIHGFGGWAYGQTDNDNIFNFATKDGEYNNYYFSLNLTAQPAENLTINSQVYWGQARHEQKMDLDYIFAQYNYLPELSFRLGKVKSPFGLYAETYDVGTLRPFYLLPQGMYQSIFPKSYVGLGITGEYEVAEEWNLAYDVIAGEMEMNGFYVEIPSEFDYSMGFPVPINFEKIHMTPVGREVVGAKVSLSPPVDGLNIGLSYMNFKFNMRRDGGEREESFTKNSHYIASGHLEFVTDDISFKSELYQIGKETETTGGYFEAAYTLFNHWQLAASYDWYENTTESTVSRTPHKPALEHKSTALGLNYWFNPNLVLKANYYMIEGNAFAQPALIAMDMMQGKTIEEKTNALIIGTQFSF